MTFSFLSGARISCCSLLFVGHTIIPVPVPIHPILAITIHPSGRELYLLASHNVNLHVSLPRVYLMCTSSRGGCS